MDDQKQTSSETADEVDSLESSPSVKTVIEPTADGISANPGQPSPTDTVSNTNPPLSPIKQPASSPLSFILSRVNVYMAVLILLILLTGGAIAFAVMHNKKATNLNSANSQNLSSSELAQLEGSNASVGGAETNLTVQSDATFNGSVLVKNGLSVAGALRVGGSLSLPGLTVTGTSVFDQIQANSIRIASSIVDQGSLTVQQGLSVAGNSNFSGTVSVGALTTSNLQLNGDLNISHHIVGGGGVPGLSDGNALGNGGTASVTGTDTAGKVTINTGNNDTSGCYANITFSAPFTNTPAVILTPTNQAGAALQYYVTPSAGGFSVCSATTPGSGQTFTYDFIVIG